MERSVQSTTRDVSPSRVFAKARAVYHNCHAHTGPFIAWDQFNAMDFLKCPVEFDTPTRQLVVLVRRKFLDVTVTLPDGFCGRFRALEGVTVFKSQRADDSCSVSEGHDLLQPYINNVWHGK